MRERETCGRSGSCSALGREEAHVDAVQGLTVLVVQSRLRDERPHRSFEVTQSLSYNVDRASNSVVFRDGRESRLIRRTSGIVRRTRFCIVRDLIWKRRTGSEAEIDVLI